MTYQEDRLQEITDALRVRKKSKDKIKAIDIAQEILDLPIGYSVESILKDDGTQTLVIFGGDGSGGIDTSDATATSDDLLLGKTAYVKDEKITGTIETWDGSFEGDAEIYNPLNDYLRGTKKEITAYDLKGVTSIPDYAFYLSPITSVTFSDTVTYIGRNAFDSTQIERFVMPDTIKSANVYFCRGCKSLKEFVIGKGVTSLGNGWIEGCTALEYIEIPDNVKSIGWYFFQNCSNLKKVKIGTGVTSISACFNGCKSLKEIICLAEKPPKFDAQNLNQLPADCIFKVPSASVEAYKTATNWAGRADYIFAYEEV